MGNLPPSTILGNLKMMEVYVEFNGARLFSCRNQVGQIFLAVWVDEEEEFNLWLYALVSLQKLNSIRSGNIDLHDAFESTEDGFIYEVNLNCSNGLYEVKKVFCSEVEEECLPLQDSFLRCEAELVLPFEVSKSAQIAISKGREVMRLILDIPSRYPTEAPVLTLGSILSDLQVIVNFVGRVGTSDQKIRVADVNRMTEFNAFATAPGSFQIDLASSVFETDIFGNSIAGNAVDELLNLIGVGKNIELLRQKMLSFPAKTATKYSNFLKSIVQGNSSIKIDWGSPTLNRGGFVEISLLNAKEILEVIKEIESQDAREYEVTGELFKVDKVKWKFGIRDNKADYQGDILDGAKSDAGTATISQLYIAKIRELSEVIPVTGVRKMTYQLLALDPYTPLESQLKLTGI
jgi:hypothetical protein